MSEENKTQWDRSIYFLFAMIGSAVGLGNIWRFPYIMYSNGGGSFLIPYLFAILIVGVSFLFLEYAVGFKFKSSLYDIFRKVKPQLEVVTWFICVVVFLIVSYYVCIIGWDLIYFVLSFFKGWGANTDAFFVTNVLEASSDISGLFRIVPGVFISVLLVWFMLWFISHRNLNAGIGKFSKYAIPLLFFLACGIVVYSLTLPGANIGYTAMFSPDWSQITNVQIWAAAFGQIIFSLSIGMGIIIAYTSYLKPGENLTKNVFTVIGANCGFEIFNAIGIFSILGFMTFSSGIPINELITAGPGLTFVALPQVFNLMGDAAYIIGPVFFLCVFLAGITSAIALAEPLTASLSSKFALSRKKASSIVCLIGFLLSVIFTTSAGSDVLTVVDYFLNNYALFVVLILEAIIFSWIYSADKLIEVLNIKTMIKVGSWWKYLIKYIVPLIFVFLLVNNIPLIPATVSEWGLGLEVSVGIIILITIALIAIPLILYKVPKRTKKAVEGA